MMCGKQECAVQDVHSKAKGKSPLYVFHTRGFDIICYVEVGKHDQDQLSSNRSMNPGMQASFSALTRRPKAGN